MLRKLLITALLFGAFIVTIVPLMRSASLAFDLDGFGELPVQYNGRLKPISALAENNLRLLRGRTSIEGEVIAGGETSERTFGATEWFLLHNFEPTYADTLPVFRVDHADVLSLFGKTHKDGKYFSWNDLSPHMDAIREAANQAPEESRLRNAFQRAVVNLASNGNLYIRLRYSLLLPSGTDDPLHVYREWQTINVDTRRAVRAMDAGEVADSQALADFQRFLTFLQGLSDASMVGISPLGERPEDPEKATVENPQKLLHWNNVGEALLEREFLAQLQLDPVALSYAQMASAWRAQDPATFNQHVALVAANTGTYAEHAAIGLEHRFQKMDPFYTAIILYVLVFIIVVISWLVLPVPLRQAAFSLLVFTFVLHTLAIVARVIIQGYAPITNLYSSAIAVGWIAVLICLLLEPLVLRNGLASAAASAIGFCTLIVAKNLIEFSSAGDTLEPMRAVLNSNFWLATHVITITLGYGAMFVAGAMGILYVLNGLLVKGMSETTAQRLYAACYGTIAFALILSFIGTMLGGIWADQSWGRFWGWDPKENGALLIVLWCALLLHARWGGLVRRRGFLALAIFGNVVTAWSWFGVNMLGIGLHTYGFMDSAFWWLLGFALSQLLIMAAAALPKDIWASPQAIR